MKRAMIACCLITAMFATVLAKPADFSGAWSLDLSKSKLPQGGGPGGGGGGMGGSPLTAQTLTIKQDDKTISIDTKSEGGMGGGGTQSVKYNLDGSETKTEMTRGNMTIPITLKAKVLNNGSLEITRTSKFTGPDGTERTSVTKETWEVADGGKTLKVHRVQDGRNGPVESDWVYTKK